MDAVYTLYKTGDQRLQQVKETYTALLGAASINFVSYQAQSPTTSTITWTVVPPSTTTVFQKAPMLDLTCIFVFFVQQTTYMDPSGVPLAKYGRDWAFAAASPVNALVNSWSIQLNNTNVQAQKVTLNDTLHCIRTPDQRASDTVTYRTPAYASWDDADGTTQGLGSFADMQGEGDVPPGAYEVTFMGCLQENNSTLEPLPSNFANATGTYFARSTEQAVVGNIQVSYVCGQPVTSLATASGPATDIVPLPTQWNGTISKAALGWSPAPLPVPIYARVRLIDVVMCSPFGFDYMDTFKSVGFFGVASLQFTAQMTTAVLARSIQGCAQYGCILYGPNAVLIAGVAGTAPGYPATVVPAYTQLPSSNPTDQQLISILSASILFTYISPMQYAVLPEQNIMPMMQQQYYPQTIQILNLAPQLGPGLPLPTPSVTFNSMTFPAIPDLILISVRPDPTTMAPNEADWCCTFPDQPFTQFNFANNPAILSGVQSFQLSQICRKNGVRDSLAVMGGSGGTGYMMSNGRKVVAGGAPLALRPGLDFPLPEGSSPGTNGQVQMNFNMKFNAPGLWKGRKYICLVTAIMKGYFITAAGTSRIILVGLENTQILGASPGPDTHSTSHLIGGALSGGGTDWTGLFNKGMNLYKTYAPAAKDAYSAGRNLYDKYKAATPASAPVAVGSGMSGGSFGTKRSMTDRLCM
jgi:hypothetical protein